MAIIENVTNYPTLKAGAYQAVLYGEELLAELLARQRFSVRKDSECHSQLRQCLVYCIHETSVPNRKILLNRNYKPIGSSVPSGGPYADYDVEVSRHVHLTEEQVRQFGTPRCPGFLYLDDTKPWLSRKLAERYLSEVSRLKGLLHANAGQ